MTIQIFEYDFLRIGSRMANASFKKRHFDYLTRFSPSKYFQLGHQGIRFSHYVGVIQVLDLTIEILPKIDRGITEENHWKNFLIDMLRYCRLLKIESLGAAKLSLKKNSILDVYYELFLFEVERILQRGLYHNYQKVTENRKSLKGHLLLEQHLWKNWLHKERFYTCHDTYDTGNVFNQIIAAALHFLKNIKLSPFLQTKLKSLQAAFPSFSTFSFHYSDFEALAYNRQNHHYKNAIQIAQLLLLQNRPSLRSGNQQLVALLFDMNLLFEEYIFRQLCRLRDQGIQVSRQQRKEFWNRQQIRPDILLRKGNKRYIIDTKWKVLQRPKPTMSDLQQAFAYGQYFDAATTVLLYPKNAKLKSIPPKSFQLPTYKGDYRCGLFFAEVVKDGKLNLEIGKEIVDYISKE